MAEENHIETKNSESHSEEIKIDESEKIKNPALAENNSDDGTELCIDKVENTDTGDISKQAQKETTETIGKVKKLTRSEKKKKKLEEYRQQKKANRKQKKIERRERDKKDDQDPSADSLLKQGKTNGEHRELKAAKRQKCEEALQIGQKICIDCSLEEYMSTKEKVKLSMQVGRLYGSNRKADEGAHIYLTGLKKDGELYRELVRINDGFLRWVIDTEEKSHTELFPLDKIVVLTPDSDTVLQDIEPDKVYIIGGLVDENVTKNVTLARASEVKVATVRLPIDEYMEKIDQPSHSKILAVNQVFDILLTFISTRNWKTALAKGVPQRKGFIIKEDDT